MKQKIVLRIKNEKLPPGIGSEPTRQLNKKQLMEIIKESKNGDQVDMAYEELESRKFKEIDRNEYILDYFNSQAMGKGELIEQRKKKRWILKKFESLPAHCEKKLLTQ